ncbi:MarR family winged helix-turn-helix transcriptional regulator [Segeticoccus rhizosphaerae]|jgi:DNA-binding MarR family transcriptional regulator|uniref:MarR family winged helix-turn-helix transcriptional regulator n=1 Tax=Segeticoccus rhizosphaerae TaxID=1104777 RepID=UPI00192E70A8|nr:MULTISPECIES: MarR family transcriptional regulator [Intrasporangiaceae]
MSSPALSVVPAALADDLGFLLARASATALRATNDALRDTGLRSRHYVLLKLAAEGDGVPQRRVVDDLGLDPSAVVVLVDDLERRDLVERVQDPGDRRTRIIAITSAGRRLLRQARPLADTTMDTLLRHLGAEQRQELAALLGEMLEAADPKYH